MKTSDNMELKAWKRLAELRDGLNDSFLYKARNSLEYKREPAEIEEKMETFANPAKWVKSGYISESNAAELHLLEYLLDDDKKEIGKYKNWQPPAR